MIIRRRLPPTCSSAATASHARCGSSSGSGDTVTGAAMRFRRPAVCLTAFVSLVFLAEQSAPAQGRRGGGPGGGVVTSGTVPFDRRDADPLAGPVVSGAPFSADATTTVVQTLSDGT